MPYVKIAATHAYATRPARRATSAAACRTKMTPIRRRSARRQPRAAQRLPTFMTIIQRLFARSAEVKRVTQKMQPVRDMFDHCRYPRFHTRR